MLASWTSATLISTLVHDAYAYQRVSHPHPNFVDGWLGYQRWLYSKRAPGNTCLAALYLLLQSTASNNSKGCGTGYLRPVRFLAAQDCVFAVAWQITSLPNRHLLLFASSSTRFRKGAEPC